MFGKMVNTATIWRVAERRPLDVVLADMAKDGWVNINCERGELTRVVLKLHTKTAILYAKNDVVGMVAFDC